MDHFLKAYSSHWQKFHSGQRKFTIRKNNQINEGDNIIFVDRGTREAPIDNGQKLETRVDFVWRGPSHGLQQGYSLYGFDRSWITDKIENQNLPSEEED